MKSYGLSVLCLATLAFLMGMGCGSSSQRMLQSITVAPATATAQGNPVQFTATGDFNDQPSPMTLSSANWGACQQNQATTGVTVDANGLAHCASGATGTYTVWAWAERGGGNCGTAGMLPNNPCGGAGQCQVTGTAQLTCP